MYRIILIIIWYFAFSFFVLAESTHIPIDNLYENTNVAPVEFSKKHYKEFYHWYFALTGEKPTITYKYKTKMVALIPKSSINDLLNQLGKTKFKVQPHFPFRYYDETYKARFLKGYKELSDILTGYKDYKLNEMYLRGISEEFPDLVSYFNLGKTHGGRDIPAVRITINNLQESKASILFNCSHHSNELLGTEHCYDIIYTILNNSEKYKKLLENVNLWIVPIVNPDGSYLFWYKNILMGRKNGYLFPEQNENFYGRGVDLNRNYPFKWNSGHPTASSDKKEHPFFRGLSPASEPETQAMMSLAERERFVFSMSFHTFAARILYPYTIENTTNPSPDFPKELAKRLVKVATSYSPTRVYEAVKNIYPVDGTDQDYYYFKYGTIALLTESTHKNIPYEYVNKILDGFRPVWQKFLDEYLDGYKLILKVLDEEDNPVHSTVSIEEYILYEGEEFTNNPLTGFYHKVFPDKSEYTVKISAEGYGTEIFKFRPRKDFQVKTIVMKKN